MDSTIHPVVQGVLSECLFGHTFHRSNRSHIVSSRTARVQSRLVKALTEGDVIIHGNRHCKERNESTILLALVAGKEAHARC